MSVLKCKMCGASLEINDSTIAVCEYCGSQQTLPKTSEDVVTNLFNRANNLRLKSEFDKAMQIYEKILNQNNNEAEAHWGIVLCKYGIEYVEDPKTFKRVPTCHRTQYESVLADVDYLAAVANSDGDTKELYKSQAEEIAALQKDILAIVKNEKPFDVFICYKETDENGKRTIDSSLANDIYYQLTQEGLKVFYAAITLEDKLGMEYEPYIFAALNSAKVMLVVGTKTEYFDAVWVRNEWSRYLKMMKEDRSKLLIPCYRDMDAYDLPEEFSHLQAQDMSKIGFVNDIVRGIKKVVGSDEPKPVVIRETVAAETVAAPAGVAPLLTRAFMFLEDGDFERADSFCEQVLNQEPDNAQAYVGKLMADLHVKKQEFLKNHPVPFEGNNNYNKALRFGDDDLKNELKGYISHIYTRNENARLEGIYARAKDIISSEKTEKTYKEAAQLFESISEYKDSAALAKDCYEKAEAARKDAIYADAVEKMDRGAWGCTSAISQFESISGWKDADEKINECKAKIDEIKKEEAKEVAKIKKFALIGIAALVALIAFFVILNNLIIPSGKYKEATELMENGQTYEALSLFNEIENYKDSQKKIEEIWDGIAVRDTISVGYDYTVGLQANGQVIIVGDKPEGLGAASDWTDIVAISSGSKHTVGLMDDGTVVAAGDNDNDQCDVSGWNDIVAISAGNSHTVGLKKDGTVMATGDRDDGQCEVWEWTDIVSVSAGYDHTVGLKSDGTVVATTYRGVYYKDRCYVSDWKDIVAISAGSDHTVGLKKDGTVVAIGNNYHGQCDVSDWKDIVAISAGSTCTVGLKKDGTVVAVGDNYNGQCDVSDWTDIVAISSDYGRTVGLKKDGTVVAVGNGQSDFINEWSKKFKDAIPSVEF